MFFKEIRGHHEEKLKQLLSLRVYLSERFKQPLPSPMNTRYKISIHSGNELIATCDQKVYRTSKISLISYSDIQEEFLQFYTLVGQKSLLPRRLVLKSGMSPIKIVIGFKIGCMS